MKGTWKPVAAGILNVISGIFLLMGGFIFISTLVQPAIAALWAGYAMHSLGLSGAPNASFVTSFITTLAVALIVPGIISVLGGIFAIKRRAWGIALAGGISTFVYLPLFGLSAIILLALSKRVFSSSFSL